MRLTLAGRRSALRAAARPDRLRYAVPRGCDEVAARIAFCAAFAASLALVLFALPAQP